MDNTVVLFDERRSIRIPLPRLIVVINIPAIY